MKKLFVYLILVGIMGSVDAQKINSEKFKAIPVDTASWEQLQLILNSNDTIKADELARNLFSKLEKNQDPKGNLRMLNDISMWYMDHRMLAKGKQVADSLLTFYPGKFDTLHIDYAYIYSNLAYYYHLHNQFEKKAKYQNIKNNIIKQIDPSHPLMVEILTEQAGELFANRKLAEGFKVSEKALKIAREQEMHYYTVLLYMNMANIIKFYEPYLALSYMNYSTYLAEKYQKEYYENDPYFYINRGACYVACDQMNDALNIFTKGLAVLKKQEHPPVNFETAFYYYIGVCHKNLNNYEKAAKYYDTTANIFAGLFSKKHQAYLRNIHMVAANKIDAGKYGEALELLKEIYPLSVEVYGFNETYYTAQIGEYYAKALYETGHYLEALKQNHQNIAYYYGDSIPGNPYRLPKIDSTKTGKDRASLLLSYLGKAKALQKLYIQHPQDTLMQNIIAHFKACAQISDITINGPIDEKDARSTTYHLRKLTNTALDFAIEQNLEAKTVKEIYKIISKTKAYALLGSIYNNEEGIYSEPMFMKKQRKIEELEARLTNQSLKKSEKYEHNFAELLQLKRELFIYKRTHPVNIQELKMKRIANIDNINVTSNVKPNQCVIDIYLTGTNIITFAIDNDAFHYYHQPENKSFTKSVRELQRAVKTNRNITGPAKEIYASIIGPIKNKLIQNKELTIIPDGILFVVPFEILQDDQGRFLVESNPVQYRYTSHLYQNQTKPVTSNTLLAIAPVFKSETNHLAYYNPVRSAHVDSLEILRGSSEMQLETLPYSEEETRQVNNRFKSKNWTTTLLLNTEATEEAFKKEAPDKSIIHLATHGYVDSKNPEKSGLFLAQTNSRTEDNYLYMSELYNMGIDADLVVLSACKSGYGKLWSGEGILALPRAFLAGGTHHVLSSLWKIHDEKTKELMILFYDELEKEGSYIKALQKAKIRMLKAGELPIDWSGFTLIKN